MRLTVPQAAVPYLRKHAEWTALALNKTAWSAAPWWKRMLTRLLRWWYGAGAVPLVVWTPEDDARLEALRVESTALFDSLEDADRRAAAAVVCAMSPQDFVITVRGMR